MLYDLVHCPHRPAMDLYGDPAQRDEVNVFVQLLWERGSVYEKVVIVGLDIPVTDLSAYGLEEKEQKTAEAMARGDALIYGGRISADNLLGDPDLLRKEGSGYIAGDIKSGSGEEGPEDGAKPKKHYVVQLGLYTDILERKGSSGDRRAFIWDVHGQEVIYDFTELIGKRDPPYALGRLPESSRRSGSDRRENAENRSGVRGGLQDVSLVLGVLEAPHRQR
jgi:hypothetical protein